MGSVYSAMGTTSGRPSAGMTRCLTQAERKAYHKDGVVCLRGILDQAWVDEMRQGFTEAMQSPGRYAEFIGEDTTWGTMFEEGSANRNIQMFQDQFCTLRVQSLARVAKDSPAAPIIAELLASTTATFFYDHLILKRSGAEKAIPWHQDLPYWKVDGQQIGSIWIPLDPMPEASSVQYIPGSHRWGLLRPRHFVDSSPYANTEDLPSMPDIDALLAESKVQGLRFSVSPGDVVAFDARIVHGSPGNMEPGSGDQRRIALRFVGDDATYCERPGETAIPSPDVDALHGLRHGDPLTCDIFPRVWPRD